MDTGLTKPVAVVLLVAVCVWSVPAAAFCFSMGGGNRNHAGYNAPPPPPGFGYGRYPASPYMAPAPRTVILPVIIREDRLPAVNGGYPAQHIFR